jgi:microsomal prostaglandin-E synthase 2
VPTFTLPRKAILHLGGGLAMFFAKNKIKKKYKFDDERQELMSVLKIWDAELEQEQGPFHGGYTPDIADVAIFGVIRSIQGTRTFSEIMSEHALLAQWYTQVDKHIAGC